MEYSLHPSHSTYCRNFGGGGNESGNTNLGVLQHFKQIPCAFPGHGWRLHHVQWLFAHKMNKGHFSQNYTKYQGSPGYGESWQHLQNPPNLKRLGAKAFTTGNGFPNRHVVQQRRQSNTTENAQVVHLNFFLAFWPG